MWNLANKMKNVNYNKARELKEFWSNNWNRMTHQGMKVQLGLPDGPRFPEGLPKEGVQEGIDFLKKYLKETEVHEFSGAIYGDLRSLIQEKISHRRIFLRDVLPGDPAFSTPPSSEVILSETVTLYYSGYYYLCSSSRYWTHMCPSPKYRILYKSKNPIHTMITVRGDVSMHTRGFIL